MNRALLVLALLVPLAACSGSGDAPSTAASPVPSTSSAPSATLVLRGDGLSLQEAGGTTRQIPFGSPMSVVVPAMTAALGEPEPLAVRCAKGIRDTLGAGGFDVLFDEDRFVGWDESGAGLSTADGLELGVTRADVQRLLPDARFTTTSVGPEFASASGLGGFLDGESPTSVVVGLTGGESCVVR